MAKLNIATHNSATGEPSYKWYHKLLVPFAKCQSKTIKEQWKSGCRYFDLRVKKVNGIYRMAHGIWTSERSLISILLDLCYYSKKDNDAVYVIITYEGDFRQEFLSDMQRYAHLYPTLIFCSINVKKPIWRCLWYNQEAPLSKQGFLSLDGHSWHTYLPLPWLWKRLYYNEPQFNEKYYTLVDFL